MLLRQRRYLHKIHREILIHSKFHDTSFLKIFCLEYTSGWNKNLTGQNVIDNASRKLYDDPLINFKL